METQKGSAQSESTPPDPGEVRRRPTTSRVEIREAGARVFLEKGYLKATLGDIAVELGRPKGSIHYHIDSKQDLLFEIVEHSLTVFDTAVDKIVAYPLSAIDRLRLILREHVHWVLNPQFAYTATAAGPELASLRPEQLEIVSQHRRGYRAVVYKLLREATEAGDLRVDNVTIAARAILSVVVQLPRWYSPDGPLNPDEMADALWSLMLNGLQGPADQPGSTD